jgi:hypothetical protein
VAAVLGCCGLTGNPFSLFFSFLFLFYFMFWISVIVIWILVCFIGFYYLEAF